jgi:hypothetical protein
MASEASRLHSIETVVEVDDDEEADDDVDDDDADNSNEECDLTMNDQVAPPITILLQ